MLTEAKDLKQIKDSMDCLYFLTAKVYFIWARYEEAVSNYQTLLKYYDSVNDSRMRAHVLNGIAMIHDRKGEDDQALKLYNQSLEIKREIGDQQGITRALNTDLGLDSAVVQHIICCLADEKLLC